MTAATFRLATVERLREQEVSDCAQHLHRLTAQITEVQQQQEHRHQLLENAFPTGRFAAEQLELAARYVERLRWELHRGHEQLAALELDRRQAGERWRQARTRLRAVQTLHERHRQSRREQQLRAEQRDLDELAGAMSARAGGHHD